MASPLVKLNNGKEMPQVGFGLWKVPNDVASDTVYNAIKAGYRLFDGACGEFKKNLSSLSRVTAPCRRLRISKPPAAPASQNAPRSSAW